MNSISYGRSSEEGISNETKCHDSLAGGGGGSWNILWVAKELELLYSIVIEPRLIEEEVVGWLI